MGWIGGSGLFADIYLYGHLFIWMLGSLFESRCNSIGDYHLLAVIKALHNS